jgi:MFS family permease
VACGVISMCSTYRELLLSSAGALAGLPQAMVGLGSLLLVTGLGGSYTRAGLVSGATSVTQATAGPQLSQLADRFGHSRVLWPQLLVHVSALALLVDLYGPDT